MSTTISSRPHSSDSGPISTRPLPQHHIEWTTLPSDVVVEIFSYLTQRDCLTCMAVCRNWYDSIPHYVQDIWATVQFGVRDSHMENKRQIRCLGEHVEAVIVNNLTAEEDLSDLMSKFLEWGCTNIISLEFRNCSFENQDEFLAAVSNLAPHLTHMKMIGHETDVAFRHLFHLCPELTHFTFLGNREFDWEDFSEPEVKMELPTTKQHPNIKYLCIDADLNPQLRLKPILELCPNLRCFIGASWNDEPWLYGAPHYISAALSPDIIIELCPKITHLQNTFSYNSTVNKLEYYDDSREDGLRYFGQCEDSGHEPIVQILTKHQTTLEHLCLTIFDPTERYYDWSPVFESLRFLQLRVLELVSVVRFSESSLFTLLNHCPLIEKLSWQQSSSRRIDRSMVERLHILPHLRTFKCSGFKLCSDVSLMNLLARFPALEDFLISYARLPLTLPMTNQYPKNLKRLHLKHVQMLYDGDDREDRVASFIQCLTAHSPDLQEVKLRLFYAPAIGSKWLKAIANIPALKICEIEIDRGLSMEVEQDSVKQFIHLLEGTMIERLNLYHLRDLSYDILDALGNLPLLTQLNFRGNGLQMRLDGQGLLNMLRKSTRLTAMTLQNVVIDGIKQGDDDLIEVIKQEILLYDTSYEVINDPPHIISIGSENYYNYRKLTIVKRQKHT